MSILVDGVLVPGPFELTIRDRAGTDVVLHGGLRNVRDVRGLSGMAARVSVRSRIGRSGSTVRTRHREDRMITVESQILAPDNPQQAWDDYYVMSRAVNSAVDTGRLLRWTLGNYSLQSVVRAESIEPPAVIAGRILETQMTFRASDPRAYGQVLREVGPVTRGLSVTVDNAGSVETPPLIILNGPLTTPSVDFADGRKLVLYSLGAGAHYLDAERRTVEDSAGNGLYGLFNAAASRWFDIPPGQHTVTLTAPDGTGTMTVRTRDAYQ